MQKAEILEIFKSSRAILSGHFILSSGLHSDTYLQCARVMMDPRNGERLCATLAAKIRKDIPAMRFDLIASPALGGVIVGYELARQMQLPAIFCERENGQFAIRRGFSIPAGAKVLVVEDVITTGKSSLETFDCIKKNGGNVVAEAALIDRSGGTANLGVPLVTLLTLEVPAYTADKLPETLQAIPAIKPGSRTMKTVV